jgi:hypothetical protein
MRVGNAKPAQQKQRERVNGLPGGCGVVVH